ncbi:hypothetical protein Tco_0059766 [Tanacetum coccineum]
MAEPLSPDHVFDFPKDDPAHDHEEFEEEPEEDPEEEPEEEPKKGPEEVTGVSPIFHHHYQSLHQTLNSQLPSTADRTVWMLPPGSIFEVGGPSYVPSFPPHLLSHKVKRLREVTKSIYGSVRVFERDARTRQAKIIAARTGVDRFSRHMDAYDVDLGFVERDATRTSDQVLVLQEENCSLRGRVDSLEMAEMIGWGAMEARPSDSIDVLVVYGTAQPSEPQGPPDSPQ